MTRRSLLGRCYSVRHTYIERVGLSATVSGISAESDSSDRPPRTVPTAEFAQEWKEMGARIIGGCCASGPEHIMAMRPVVKGNTA